MDVIDIEVAPLEEFVDYMKKTEYFGSQLSAPNSVFMTALSFLNILVRPKNFQVNHSSKNDIDTEQAMLVDSFEIIKLNR